MCQIPTFILFLLQGGLYRGYLKLCDTPLEDGTLSCIIVGTPVKFSNWTYKICCTHLSDLHTFENFILYLLKTPALSCTPDTCCPASPTQCVDMAVGPGLQPLELKPLPLGASCFTPWLLRLDIQGLLTNWSHLWNAKLLKVLFVSCLFGYSALKITLKVKKEKCLLLWDSSTQSAHEMRASLYQLSTVAQPLTHFST